MARIVTKTRKKQGKGRASKLAAVVSRKPFKTYDEAIKYLFNRTNYEQEKHLRYNVDTFNLKRMEHLLSLVGNPHTKIDTVHIAGTKGKGSTATMLAKMIEANGYKVGLYTSPHVVDLHERIMVNSEMITRTAMLGLLNRIYKAVENVSKTSNPTFFEIMTAIAFMHFADTKADVAVIETGLGGRLDSTNVIKPKVVGITNLSFDHQKQLGSTIEEIAKEKAGIFKPGVPIVTVQQDPNAMRVLKAQAAAVKAPFSVTGVDIDFSHRFETSSEHGPHNRVCLTTPTSKFEHLRVPLHGIHQAINCGLALAMLDKLKGCGFDIDNDKTIAGLAKGQTARPNGDDLRGPANPHRRCPQRRQHQGAYARDRPEHPLRFDDSNLRLQRGQGRKGMLQELQFGADKVIFTRSNSAKAMSPDELVRNVCRHIRQDVPKRPGSWRGIAIG